MNSICYTFRRGYRLIVMNQMFCLRLCALILYYTNSNKCANIMFTFNRTWDPVSLKSTHSYSITTRFSSDLALPTYPILKILYTGPH